MLLDFPDYCQDSKEYPAEDRMSIKMTVTVRSGDQEMRGGALNGKKSGTKIS